MRRVIGLEDKGVPREVIFRATLYDGNAISFDSFEHMRILIMTNSYLTMNCLTWRALKKKFVFILDPASCENLSRAQGIELSHRLSTGIKLRSASIVTLHFLRTLETRRLKYLIKRREKYQLPVFLLKGVRGFSSLN